MFDQYTDPDYGMQYFPPKKDLSPAYTDVRLNSLAVYVMNRIGKTVPEQGSVGISCVLIRSPPCIGYDCVFMRSPTNHFHFI